LSEADLIDHFDGGLRVRRSVSVRAAWRVCRVTEGGNGEATIRGCRAYGIFEIHLGIGRRCGLIRDPPVAS